MTNPLTLWENSTSTFKLSLFSLPFADRRALLESLSEEFTSLDDFIQWCTTECPENDSCSTNCPMDDSEATTSSSNRKRR